MQEKGAQNSRVGDTIFFFLHCKMKGIIKNCTLHLQHSIESSSCVKKMCLVSLLVSLKNYWFH